MSDAESWRDEAGADRMRATAEAMEAAEQAAGALSNAVGLNLRRSLEEAARGAAGFGEVARRFAQDMARDGLRAAVDPLRRAVGDGVGALTGSLIQGLGGAISGAGAGVRAFAKGGVVEGATAFPMAGGAGLMGEAGPEAILPLARAADGRLGVRGGGGVHVTLNVSTPDVEGFRRSGPQVAAELARAVTRGRRVL